MNNNEESYSFKDVFVQMKSFFSFLLSKWYYIVLAAIIGGALGGGFYTIQKPKYEAVCSFILEEKQSGLGGLSGIASQFGFDLGGMGGGSIFAGDNILEILKSRNIINNVLLSPVDSGNSKKLIDLLIEFNGWKKKWEDNARLKGINFYAISSSSQPLTLQQDSVLAMAQRSLIKNNILIERLTKKGSIIQVSITAENEVFAKLLSERIVSDAKEMYLQIKVGNSRANVLNLQQKADSLLKLSNAKSYQTASSFVIDANPALRTSAVPSELSLRDKMVVQTLYVEVVKNLELHKIALMQQTPVIQILDSPSYPLFNKTKSLPLLVIIGSFVGLLVTALFLFIKFNMRS
jgi:uncharacterized protein involved in exopolysaccharide biosynthesis